MPSGNSATAPPPRAPRSSARTSPGCARCRPPARDTRESRPRAASSGHTAGLLQSVCLARKRGSRGKSATSTSGSMSALPWLATNSTGPRRGHALEALHLGAAEEDRASAGARASGATRPGCGRERAPAARARTDLGHSSGATGAAATDDGDGFVVLRAGDARARDRGPASNRRQRPGRERSSQQHPCCLARCHAALDRLVPARGRTRSVRLRLSVLQTSAPASAKITPTSDHSTISMPASSRIRRANAFPSIDLSMICGPTCRLPFGKGADTAAVISGSVSVRASAVTPDSHGASRATRGEVRLSMPLAAPAQP